MELFIQRQSPWSSEVFARLAIRRVGPFIHSYFPPETPMRILMDSEPLLHTSVPKAALAEFGL